jgi:hypothetical protein
LKLGIPKLAIVDCDVALSLISEPILTPEVARMKVRLLSRKTAALFEEKRYVEAFQSCAEILKYNKGDPDVKADVDLLIKLAGAKLRETKELIETLQSIETGSAPKTEPPVDGA